MGRPIESDHTEGFRSIGDRSIMNTENTLSRVIISCAIGNDLHIQDSPLDFRNMRSMHAALVNLAKQTDGDWTARTTLDMYRKNPRKFTDTLLKGSTCVEDLHSLYHVVELIKATLHAPEEMNTIVEILQKLSDSQLTGIRLVCVCASAAALGLIMSYPRLMHLTNRLVQIIMSRARDSSEVIRRLSGQDIVCESMHLIGVISDDILCAAIQGLLADPVRTIRLRTVSWISQQLTKKPDSSRLTGLIDRFRDSFLRCCFDTDISVQICALKLVSNPNIGDKLLGDDEAAFQRISNLIWFVDTGYHVSHERGIRISSDPFRISREALVFVDTHIFASPGVLVPGNDDSKIAALVEFLIQYSDNFVHGLCDRLVGTFLSYFQVKRMVNVFLLRGELFTTCISSYNDQNCVMHSPSSQSEVFDKLCAVLELLLSVLTLSSEDHAVKVISKGLCNAIQDVLVGRECRPDNIIQRSSRCVKKICLDIGARVGELLTVPSRNMGNIGHGVCICNMAQLRDDERCFWLICEARC